MSTASVESPRRGPGIKGRRIPGRPGRFDPSIPMHMTTRKRAKGSADQASPSINGSTEDDDSRRGSLESVRPTTSHSQPSQASPEAFQFREASQPVSTPQQAVRSSPEDSNSKQVDVASPQTPASQRALTPSLKRKRDEESPPTTPINVSAVVVQDEDPDEEPLQADGDDGTEDDGMDAMYSQQVTDADSISDERENAQVADAAASFDDTPAGSHDVSPASSVSDGVDLADQAEVPKDIRTTDDLVAEPTADAVEADEDDEDEEIETPAQVSTGIRPAKKLVGKRRRAEHPNPDVEIAMRRQLELKKSFRNMAREVKAVLAEISQRTLDELTTNPKSFEEAAEFHYVTAGLDEALTKRKAAIRAQHHMDLMLLRGRMQEEQFVRKEACKILIENARDTAVDNLQHDILMIARQANLVKGHGGNDTEDEDDVVPRPKQAAYRYKRFGVIDEVHESRSRHAMETERSIDKLDRQVKMRKLLHEFDPDLGHDTAAAPFAVMDSTTRDANDAIGRAMANLDILVEAADETERIASVPIIKNEDARGLQTLSELCMRPSIAALLSQNPRPLLTKEHMMQQTSQSQAMSPPSHPSISVEMSPRASQVLRERFEGMPPPQTPRQAEANYTWPFGAPHGEQNRPSPALHRERPLDLPHIAARPPDSERRMPPSPRRLEPERREEPPSPGMPRPWPLQSSPRHSITEADGRPTFEASPSRRSRSAEERPPFELFRGQPPWSERPPYDRPTNRDQPPRPNPQSGLPSWLLNERPPSVNQHSPTARDFPNFRPWMPQASGAGAGVPPSTDRPPFSLEIMHHSRSRNTSVSIKHEARPDSSPRDEKPNQQQFRFQEVNKPKQIHKKTNKEERGGESRRRHRNKKKPFDSRPQSVSGASASSLPQSAPPYTAGFGQQNQGRAPWDVPPPQPHNHLAAFPRHSMGPLGFSHPPPGLLPPGPGGPPFNDFRPDPRDPRDPRKDPRDPRSQPGQHHRNSFPPGGSPGPEFARPSPLFALPQQHPPHGPAPPGIDRYGPQPGFAGPPPGHPLHHQGPPMTPQPPPPPPLTGPNSVFAGQQQFGGLAIAPAGMRDPHMHPPSFRPGPPIPAFAQQHGATGRRRTTSETHIKANSWRNWPGPSDRRP